MSENQNNTNSNASLLEQIKVLAGNAAKAEGCELYDLEFHGKVLTVFIDKQDEGGARIGDCTNVSRSLNELLDQADIIQQAYDLEVSTPGLERNLKEPWHFQKVIGKKIWVKTPEAFSSYGVNYKKYAASKQLSEVLTAASDTEIEFSLEGEAFKLPIAAIEKAKLVFEMPEKGPKKSHAPKKKKH